MYAARPPRNAQSASRVDRADRTDARRELGSRPRPGCGRGAQRRTRAARLRRGVDRGGAWRGGRLGRPRRRRSLQPAAAGHTARDRASPPASPATRRRGRGIDRARQRGGRRAPHPRPRRLGRRQARSALADHAGGGLADLVRRLLDTRRPPRVRLDVLADDGVARCADPAPPRAERSRHRHRQRSARAARRPAQRPRGRDRSQPAGARVHADQRGAERPRQHRDQARQPVRAGRRRDVRPRHLQRAVRRLARVEVAVPRLGHAGRPDVGACGPPGGRGARR